MTIQRLDNEASSLLDLLENGGDLEDLNSNEMDEIFDNAAQTIRILEGDRELGHLVLGGELDRTLLILKTIAVTMNQARTVKGRLEDILGHIDLYECVDVIEAFCNNLHQEED